MASRRFQQSVTVPTVATQLSTLLTDWPVSSDPAYAALEAGMQANSANTGKIRWGMSATLTLTNGMELDSYTERSANGEVVQVDDIYVIADTASQKLNFFARL